MLNQRTRHAVKVRSGMSQLARRLAFGVATMAASAPAWGTPEFGQVVAGQASFRQFGPNLTITASNGAIINYWSFNIGPSESVRFVQPSADSRVLNRITGPDPSVIAGRLTSNGIVYIMNPSGVYFRQGALVNVGQIYAGAARLSDADFLAGRNHFTDVSGSVINEGQINAQAAHLVGQAVSNPGTISAPGGVVTMVAGDDVLIGEAGGNVFVRVTSNTPPGGTTADFGREAARVSNTGSIHAPGGSTTLAAGDVYGMAIFNGGNITARNIRLEGQGTGVVDVSGRLDASAPGDGERGGTIAVTGQHVRVQGASLDASGEGGGGRIMVGGDFQGGGTLRRAETTFVDSGSTLRADATAGGANGGTVVAWADGITGFYGTASVRGGAGGAGGLIETSGLVYLDVRGAVIHAGAEDGVGGMWLLDPSDVTIQNAATANATFNAGTGAYTLDGDNAVVNAADISAALSAGANVTIHTNRAAGAQSGNITMVDSITANNAGDVTFRLQAANNITINVGADITASGAGALNIQLASNDVTTQGGAGDTDPSPTLGSVFANGNITTNGGSLVITNAAGSGANGIPGVTLSGTIDLGAGALSITTNANAGSGGSITLGGPVTAGSVTTLSRLLNMSGGTVTTTGHQTYRYTTSSSIQGLTLNADTMLTSSGGDITLGQAGDLGTIRGAAALTLDAAGTLTINTTIGSGASRPTTLSATAASILLNSGISRTSAGQTWDGPVTLSANALTFTATSLTFNGFLRGAVAGSTQLIINATGTSTFNGDVGGGGGSFSSIAMSGAGGNIVFNTGTVTSTGLQQYINAVTLGADATFTGSEVQFLSNVDGTAAGQQSLTVTGNALFSGSVGAGTTLELLSVSGTTTVEDVIHTAGTQTFGGAVTLAGTDGTNREFMGSTITFNGTVNAQTAGSQGADFIGNVVFNGAVGGTTALGAISTTGGTATIGTTTVRTAAGLNSGDQTYGGAVVLNTGNDSTVTFNAGAGTVAFNSTLDGTAAGEQSLAVTGNASFAGAVGATQALGAVSVSGSTVIAANVTTTNAGGASGNQTYTGDVDLGGANDSVYTLTSTGGTVAFGGALDAAVAGEQGLMIAGDANFGGAVGAGSALRSLSVSGTSMIAGPAVSTSAAGGGSGAQTYTGGVTLTSGAGTVVTFNGTSVDFAGGINASAAGQQGLIVNGATTFGASSGLAAALRSITINGAANLNAAQIVTSNVAGGTGNQLYSGAVTLGVTTVGLGSTGGTISFGSTVNATAAGNQGLLISGNAVFDGAVGGTEALRDLTISGTTAINGGSIATTNAGGGSGNQTFTGPVTIGGANGSTTTLTSTGGTVQFAGLVDALAAAQQGLMVAGAALFGGNVGSTNALRDLAVTGAAQLTGGTSILTSNAAGGTGDQTFGGAVTLAGANGSSVALNSTGGTVTFGSTVDASAAGAQGLTASGPVVLNGILGGTNALASIAFAGTTTFNAGATAISTSNALGGTGDQAFGGVVTLDTGNDSTVTLTSTGGTVSFGAAVDGTAAGEQSLVVDGNASFSGDVGAGTALGFLSVSGATVFNTGAASVVTTTAGGATGNQSYDGAVTLNTGAGSTLTLTSTGGQVEFFGTVDAAAAGEQALDIIGNAFIGGNVGSGTALRSISISGTTDLGGNITTTDAGGGSGDQTFTGAVTIVGATGFTATLTSTGGLISFVSTVDAGAAGEQSLATVGNVTFGGNVGVGTALGSLSASGGTISLPAMVTTSNVGGGTGHQTYGSAIVLTTDTTLTATGGTVSFLSTLDGTTAGQEDLTINGDADFGDAVGGTTALGALSVSGATTVSGGGLILTDGTQTFTGAVILGVDTTFESLSGDLVFGSTIDSADATARSVVFNSSGMTTFGGDIGSTFALGTLTTDAAGSTTINASSITLTGDASFGDDVVLGSDLTINASDVAFGGTLDGTVADQQGLTINTPMALGTISFGGSVGGNTQLEFLNLNGVLTLTADTTFVINSITLANIRSTGGAWNLTLTCAVDAAIGNTLNADMTPAVNNLLSNGTGTTTLLAGSTIRTAGTQTYASGGGTLIGGTAGQNVTLVSDGAVTFMGTIDSAAGGSRGLIVTTAADTTFSGAIGMGAALSRLQTDGTGSTFLGAGTIITDGSTVIFDDAVVLTADTTITDSGGGVFFNNTVDSDGTARSLTVNTPGGGTTLFAADVGGTSALSSLTTTTSGGMLVLGSMAGPITITVAGPVDLAGDTQLDHDVTIMAGAGDVRFRGTIDSISTDNFSLTVNSSGHTQFDDLIGASRALGSLTTDAAGTLQLGDATNGGTGTLSIVTVGMGGVSFGEAAVTLDADVIIDAVTGPIAFAGTIDSLNMTARSLSLNTTGNASIVGNVGVTNALNMLTTTGGGTLTFGDGTGNVTIMTADAQSYGSAVVVNVGAGNTAFFDAATGGVTFGQSLDAFASGVDAVSIVSNATFTGDVGASMALASLDVGGVATIGGDVTTTNAAGGTGDQTYTGAVILAGAVDSTRTLTSTGGTISFGSTIDATTAGEQGLAITGDAVFNGVIGTTALRDLSVSGMAAINTTSITTSDAGGGTGDQTFMGAVTFGTGNDSTITFSAGMGTVAFGAAVDGAADGEQSIVINGNASFAGDVGSNTALGALTITGQTTFSGASVTTTNIDGGTGTQTYGGNFILDTGNDSTVTFTATGGSVNFDGGLSGTTAGEQAVVVNGDASIAGSTTVALASLTVTGNTTLGNGNIDTTNAGGGTGNQNYGSVTLVGAPGSVTTLNADGGTITLGSVEAQADNGQSLAVNATNGGQTLFNGDIGATNALASLSVTGGASINTTSIRTTNAGGGTGDQTFSGDITFGTGNDSTITFDAVGGTVSFSGALDGQAAGEQAIVITGNAMFGGAIGMNTALASISVGGDTTINGSTVVTTDAGGGTGDQTFMGAVTFSSGSGTTFTFNTTGGTVVFGSTLDGSAPGAEAVVITGNTTFGGVVGGINALASLTVNGTATINTTAINTTNADGGTGSQTFTGLVTLGTPDDTTTIFTATGGTVDFQGGLTGTTEGEQSASIVGNARFAGTTATALGALAVSGMTTLDNASLATSNAGGASGDMTFGGALVINGGNDTTSTLSSTGGTVTFASTIDATTAGEQGLVIMGDASFNGAVGGATALRSLSVSGDSIINTNTITTTNAGGGSGNQSFAGAVSLMTGGGVAGAGNANIVTFTSTGGTITFGSTLDASGSGSETAAIVGNVMFGGAVGGTNRLYRTTVTGTANVANDIRTTTGQLFQGAITLSRDAMDNNGLSTFDGGSGPMIFMGNIFGTVAASQGILIRTDGTMRFENGVAVPNTLPTGDGQIALLRAFQAPIAIGASQIGTDALPLRSVTFDTMRATTPAISTIIFAPNLTIDGRVPDTLNAATLNTTTFAIRATDLVRFGFRDKVLSFGTLNISGVAGNSLNSAQIGDITSLRGISITADQIAMQNRGIGPILGQSSGVPSNTVFNNDTGIDLVGTSIFLSVEPFFHNGDISAPTQIPTSEVISQRLLTFASPGANNVNVPGYGTVQDFGAGDLLVNFFDNGPAPSPGFLLPFDLRSQGPVNTSISNTIAAFVVIAPPDIQLDTTLGSALLAELQEINLFARTLGPDELIESLVGRALYDDRSFSVQSAGGKVSVGRLAADVVRRLLGDFRELKVERDTYKDALTEAYTLFLDTPEGQEEPFNAAAFKAFVMRGGPDTIAAQAFAKLELIFRSVDELAIGPVETEACKRAIVEFVRPSDMTDVDLVRAVEAAIPAPVN